MKNLTFLMLALLASFSAFSQGPCSHTVTWVNVSVNNSPGLKVDMSSGTLSIGQKVAHEINWGDGNTYVSHNSATITTSSTTHWYASNAFGKTFSVKVIVTVTDTTTNTVVCKDTTVIPVTIKSQPCIALFSVAEDPANNGKVTFAITSAAVGSNTSYTWDFGDGNTGTGNTITHTYAKHGQYNVRVRTSTSHCNTWSSAYTVFPLNGCNGISSMFTKQNSSSLNAVFYANAPYVGTGQITNNYFQWRFGDGSSTTSSMNNYIASHTYSLAGYYNVTLIVTVVDSLANTVVCVDSTTKYVTIGNGNSIFYDVTRDSTTAPDTADYKVWLIKYDSATNMLFAVDSILLKSPYATTYSAFINKPAGQYRIKAAIQNNLTTGTVHVPTYGRSASQWSNATVIQHSGGGVSSESIIMLTGLPTSGPGFIGGNVNQGANKGTANGIAGLNVFLVDGSGNVIAFTETDANGAYSFSNIPVGAYSVAPENLNYATTPATLNITASKPNVTGINFERSHSAKTIVPVASGIANVANTGLEYAIFPNPATDVVTISWSKQANTNANISITDISGKTIYTGTSAMNVNTTIDVSAIQAGLYFLNVSSDAGSTTQKLTIQ